MKASIWHFYSWKLPFFSSTYAI